VYRNEAGGGPDVKKDVGGPTGRREAAQRRTEAIRAVGPTLKKTWGDRPEGRGPRSGVPKRSGRWARR